jgi:Mrp family chromosome partitioning ATPase
MKASKEHPDIDERSRRGETARHSVYQTLLYTVLQKPRERDQGGVVIALSSSNPGEGVSYVARALLQELAKCELTSVAGVNVSFLRKLHEPTVEAIRKSISRQAPRLEGESGGDMPPGRVLTVPERRGPWEGSWQYRSDCIDLLRSEFDYTIIDCPSLRESGDLLGIAPFLDGVILVVEANRTRKEQPRQSEQMISAAGGTLLGYIFNKRSTEVPRWLSPDA